MSKGFASSYRIVLLAIGLFACFAGVGARLVWLHVIDRDALLERIVKTRTRFDPELARRGDILDARGGLLATSNTRRVLGVDPKSLREEDEKHWPELARLIGMPEAELRKIFLTKFREPAPSTPVSAASAASKPAGLVVNLSPASTTTATAAMPEQVEPKLPQPIRWAVLREDIPESVYEQVMQLGIKGVYANQLPDRAYPNKHLAAHILGYVNRQGDAVAGMETYADFYLKGQNGWRVGERDGRNRELPQFLDRRIPPSDGYSVKLSIDTIVQDIVEQELAYVATTFEPLKASIVVSDPRTGFILAMANYPTFDPNEYNKVPKVEEHRMKNVAVADIYEPGSVFKIVAVAAGLEERVITPHSIFDCTLESIAVPYKKGLKQVDLPDEDHRFLNPTRVTLDEVVSYSSNRGAGQIAVALGLERFDRYARAFGFGGRLGFPIGGEVPGLLDPYEDWEAIDITRIAIGHSISATVLQMHQAMTVIANDGVLLRPQIIREVRDAAGEVVFKYDKIPIRRVVSADTARRVAQMLTGVPTDHGTAIGAAIDGYDVAGKTGTTIKLVEVERADGKKTQVYDRKRHIASFVGFFPAGRPQVAISVIVDEADRKAPGGVAYGGKVAAPSFKRIGERLIPILKIESHSHPAHPGLIAASHGGRR